MNPNQTIKPGQLLKVDHYAKYRITSDHSLTAAQLWHLTLEDTSYVDEVECSLCVFIDAYSKDGLALIKLLHPIYGVVFLSISNYWLTRQLVCFPDNSPIYTVKAFLSA